MTKLSQTSFTGGEVSPSLYARTDLARYATSLRTLKNTFVRPTGGVSNRAGTQFVYALDSGSLATLIPFVFSRSQAYMLVFQNGNIRVYSQGSYVAGAVSTAITGIVVPAGYPYGPITVVSAAHGLSPGQSVTIAGLDASGDYNLNGTQTVLATPTAGTFTIYRPPLVPTGFYSPGPGTVAANILLSTPYQSSELADLRYTQSADVLTITHQNYIPYEFVRTGVQAFSFNAVTDFEGGPFLDDNVTATTLKSSAATGVVTLTASTSIFTADHVGSLIRLSMEDLSTIPPWEANKLIAATTVDPDGLLRRSNGKVYIAAGNAAAPASGTYTGTVPPSHDEGTEADGDLNLLNGTANTRAGVYWQYLHSLFGIARITAQAGTTATATVLDYMPVVSPTTTTIWAFGAWSEDQGYPALCTYYQDRLVFANTPEAPQTEWASKTGDYHNFGVSSPLVSDDAIRQPLNARQINEIVELIPADQLIAMTSSSSWASPKRGEAWTPLTIGYDPQSFDGAAFLRAILTGESALFVQAGGTKVRDLQYQTAADKFRGDELTILARHLFADGNTIVDMDYAKEPHGILWIVRSDGALIGLTYLKEQEVIGWHRHDTQGYFERVCVIPENGIDVPYFIVRRTVNGAAVRYLERMAVRDQANIKDSFFVDSGLSYDGTNTSTDTLTISGASYEGGDSVTLTSSGTTFATSDIGDVIQFPSDEGTVRARITAYSFFNSVTAELQSPVPASLQNTPTTSWIFARDTFSGLTHLEGMEVAILADGSPEVPQTVVNGRVTIAYPAGIVHIGLAYVSDVETLDVTIFGASQSVRDNAKAIPKVSVVVEKTLGLQAGPDEANLYDLGLQSVDADYNEPWPLQDGVETGYMVTTWNKSGRVLLRQTNPLPFTILQILPTVEFGSDG